MEVVKGSMTKIIKAAASLPNNNTFILLADNHGPRKTITTNHDTTPQSNERIPYQRDHSTKRKSRIKN